MNRVFLLLLLFGIFYVDVTVLGQNNYQYDANGRLIADLSEGIVNIEWNMRDKVTRVVRADTSHAADLEFTYNATGERISKLVKPRDGNGLKAEHLWRYTYYVHNAAGEVIATYDRAYDQVPDQNNLYRERYTASEQFIGMKNRVGSASINTQLMSYYFSANEDFDGRFTEVQARGIIPPPDLSATNLFLYRGLKQYEMANHIDNILAVVGDRKLPVSNGYTASVNRATDYYAFGMEMAARTYKGSMDYRYGFAGKEKDNEIKGEGNSYDFGGRNIYDPRLGRFVSVDPQFRKGPDFSPYAYGFNSPLAFIDRDGQFGEDFRMKHFLHDDTNTELAYIYGFMDGALEMGITTASAAIKNNPAFMIFFAGEKIDQAKFAWMIASDPEARHQIYLKLKESVGDYIDKIGGVGKRSEVAYERGKLIFHIASIVGPAALKAAKGLELLRGAEEGIKIADAGAEAVSITGKTCEAASGACFVGDTEILVAGGEFVYIRNISTEENVYQLDECELIERGILKEITEDDLIKILIDGWEIIVTKDQLFLVEGEWKKAEDLVEGDKISKTDGGSYEIKKIVFLNLSAKK